MIRMNNNDNNDNYHIMIIMIIMINYNRIILLICQAEIRYIHE